MKNHQYLIILSLALLVAGIAKLSGDDKAFWLTLISVIIHATIHVVEKIIMKKHK